MNKHHVELECLYQDLFDRYGPDDSVVQALQDEIRVQEEKSNSAQHHAQGKALPARPVRNRDRSLNLGAESGAS